MNPLMRQAPAFNRRGFLALTAAGSVGLLAGCGGGSGPGDAAQKGVGGFTGTYNGPKIDLAYWNGFTGGDGPAMKALVNKFNADDPKITIKPNTIQWSDFTGAVWGPGIYQDKRYGIPLDVHCLAMYYNKDHFKKAGIAEAPTDAASFDDALKKLQAAGFKQPFWMPNLWPAHLMFLSLLWQNGGEPYAEDGSAATYDDEAGVKALTWMVDQIKKGYSPPNVDIDSQYLAFKNGKVSITWDGIWQINDLDASGMNYGIEPIPTIGDQPAVWANSHHFFLTDQAAQDTDRANAAKTFIGWMSEQSAAWSKAGMIPARNSAREEAAFTGSKQYVLNDYLENVHFLPPVPGLGDVQPQTLEIAVNEAVLQKTSPEEALSKAAKNATKLMEANQQKFGSA
jgi:multiple sugar transport system substrate-binding protein